MTTLETAALDQLKILAAKNLILGLRDCAIESLHDAEFAVFSQFGDDGIIQYLVDKIRIEPEERSFIEFGVENYREANTRFLLVHDNWRGLVMDSSSEHIAAIRSDAISWRHDLKAIQALVTRDTINGIIRQQGFAGPTGILSIDIDGNDYWVWEAITEVEPAIVIVEYNSVFGAGRAVTIPYDESFHRTRAHYSNLYWGCSLRALVLLAEKKGYAFAGSNSAGNNAYFVRRDRLGNLRVLTAEQGYVESKFRESRNRDGTLSFVGGAARVGLIEAMPIWDIEKNLMIKVKEL